MHRSWPTGGLDSHEFNGFKPLSGHMPTGMPATRSQMSGYPTNLLTAKPEAQAKFFRQPRFWDCAAVECLIQEQVERTVVPFHHFETPIPVLS